MYSFRELNLCFLISLDDVAFSSVSLRCYLSEFPAVSMASVCLQFCLPLTLGLCPFQCQG